MSSVEDKIKNVMPLLAKKTLNMSEILKIQQVYGRSTIRPQDNNHELKRKNQQINFKEFPLPNIAEYHQKIMESTFQQQWLVAEVIQSLGVCKWIWIDTNSKFAAMHEILEKEKIIAVDMEGNEWSSYSGMICLMQISTTKMNFLIDPLAVPQEIMAKLKTILEDEKILKVMHGGDNYIKWLQRDFAILLFPLLDTQTILKTPDCPESDGKSGFAALVKRFLDIELTLEEKKLGELSDYMTRPLHPDLKRYACNYTRYLIHILHQLSFDQMSGALTNSKIIMKDNIYGGKSYKSVEQEIQALRLCGEEANTFKRLHDWRNKIAKSKDQQPSEVISSTTLAASVSGKPFPNSISTLIKKQVQAVERSISTMEKDNSDILCYRHRIVRDFYTYIYYLNEHCSNRCREYGHFAFGCKNPKKKKSDAERLWYDQHPDLDWKEKKRRMDKQRQQRRAKNFPSGFLNEYTEEY